MKIHPDLICDPTGVTRRERIGQVNGSAEKLGQRRRRFESYWGGRGTRRGGDLRIELI